MNRLKLHRTVSLDGAPLFRGQKLALEHARAHGWKGRVVSGDRRKGVAEKYGKMSQAALYAGWLARKVGFNPANPPGRSTHELRSDGKAYRGPVGRPLAWWQLGLDVTYAAELVMILRQLGYAARRPYIDPREGHHVNFGRNPRWNLIRRKLWGPPLPKYRAPSRIGPHGLALIKRYEGFRSRPYKDVAGVWTIGYGHTKGVGPSTKPITQAEASRLLERELNEVYGPKVAKLNREAKLRLSQKQFDAIVSAVYNLGPGVLEKGRSLGDALRRPGPADQAVTAALKLYVYAGGKRWDGLVARRAEEAELYREG